MRIPLEQMITLTKCPLLLFRFQNYLSSFNQTHCYLMGGNTAVGRRSTGDHPSTSSREWPQAGSTLASTPGYILIPTRLLSCTSLINGTYLSDLWKKPIMACCSADWEAMWEIWDVWSACTVHGLFQRDENVTVLITWMVLMIKVSPEHLR